MATYFPKLSVWGADGFFEILKSTGNLNSVRLGQVRYENLFPHPIIDNHKSLEFYIADFSHVFCTNVKICILGLRLKSVTKILRFSHHALLFNNGYTFACLLLVSTAFYSFSRLGVTFTEKEGRICEYFWATQIFFRTFLWKYFVSQLFLLPTLKKFGELGCRG